MNSCAQTTLRFCALVAVAVFALTEIPCARAQAPAPTPPTKKTVEEEQEAEKPALVLSPFIVTADEDEGYVATDTLAGTRVRTDLKNTASAITVITSQFLKDTAVKNNQDLLVYTPGTEVSGVGGNFTGFAGVAVPNETTRLINPGNNNRVRGLDSADNTRDYFLTEIPWDSFNVNRVDLQRGPNSLLFGIGSPAGIINAGVIDAGYKRKYRIENVVDQYGSVRTAVDLNQPLLKDLLTVRVAAVDDHKEFKQKPAFNDSERIHASLRFDPKLFGKKSQTTLRVKYENGDVTSNNPRILPPSDRITPWFSAPFNKATIDTLSPGNGSLSNSSPTVALFKPGGNISFQGVASTVDVRSFFNGASASGAVPSTISDVPTNVLVGMINAGIPGLNNQAFRSLAIPTTSLLARGDKRPGSSFFLDTSLMDRSIFDFTEDLLDGPNKREFQDWEAWNVDLQQVFFNGRLALNLTYDKQDYTAGQVSWLTSANFSIGVDVNERLADGSKNPNIGRPFVAGTDAFGNFTRDIERESGRGILTLDLDAKDYVKSRWLRYVLGRNMLTGLVAKDTKDTQTVQWAQHATTTDLIPLLGQSDQQINSIIGTRAFDWIYYLGPDLRGKNSASGAGIDRIQRRLNPNLSSAVRFFNTTWNAPTTVNKTDPFTFVDFNTGKNVTGTQADNPANYIGWQQGPVNWLSANNPDDFPQLVTGGEKEKFSDRSYSLIWQGFMLGGDLVPTVGWRRDRVANRASAAPKNAKTGIAARDFDIDPATRRVESGNSYTWGGVYHLPEKLTSKLPWGTKISGFYNDSENFKADAPRRNMTGGRIGNPRGNTLERGFMVSTLNDRITVKGNWFKTKVQGATLASGVGGIFGGGGFNLYQLLVFGYQEASILQDAMNGISDGAALDNVLAQNGWTNYAFASGVAGVKATDNLKNTTPGSPYQQAQETIDAQKAIQAWLNTPAFFTKDFYRFWNVPISMDPSLAKASGRLGNAFGSTSPFTGFTSLVASLSPAASTLPVTTIDTISKGQEFELSARPLKNWNLTANFVRTRATRDNVDAATLATMAQLNQFFTGDAGKIRQFGQTSPTFSVAETWTNNLFRPFQVLLSSQGKSAPEVSRWRFNLVSTYVIDRGPLKGFRFGGASRLEAGRISGYRFNPDLGFLDVNQPFKGKDEQHFDAWLGYERKFSDKIVWSIQLNVRSVGEKTSLEPSFYQPDGSLALARIEQGQFFRLTNTIEF